MGVCVDMFVRGGGGGRSSVSAAVAQVCLRTMLGAEDGEGENERGECRGG